VTRFTWLGKHNHTYHIRGHYKSLGPMQIQHPSGILCKRIINMNKIGDIKYTLAYILGGRWLIYQPFSKRSLLLPLHSDRLSQSQELVDHVVWDPWYKIKGKIMMEKFFESSDDITLAHWRLLSSSSPPWTIGNRFCLSGLEKKFHNA